MRATAPEYNSSDWYHARVLELSNGQLTNPVAQGGIPLPFHVTVFVDGDPQIAKQVRASLQREVPKGTVVRVEVR